MNNQLENNQNSRQTRAKMEAVLVTKAWQNEDFRQELLSNPKAVVDREFGKEFPEFTRIQVLEESNDTYYLVIPKKPEVSEELSEEALESIAGGGWNVVTEGVILGGDSD